MTSRSIHVVAGVRVSFLFQAEWHPVIWLDHIFFIVLFTDSWVASTCLLIESGCCEPFFQVFTEKWGCWVVW